jgi:hypothetical protein
MNILNFPTMKFNHDESQNIFAFEQILSKLKISVIIFWR